MPVLLRYISGPVLAIILSFAVPEFHSLRYDPLMILGFIASISAILLMLIGWFFPRQAFFSRKEESNMHANDTRFYEPLVPVHRRTEGTEETVVNELKQKDSIDSGSGATVNVVSPTEHS